MVAAIGVHLPKIVLGSGIQIEFYAAQPLPIGGWPTTETMIPSSRETATMSDTKSHAQHAGAGLAVVVGKGLGFTSQAGPFFDSRDSGQRDL